MSVQETIGSSRNKSTKVPLVFEGEIAANQAKGAHIRASFRMNGILNKASRTRHAGASPLEVWQAVGEDAETLESELEAVIARVEAHTQFETSESLHLRLREAVIYEEIMWRSIEQFPTDREVQGLRQSLYHNMLGHYASLLDFLVSQETSERVGDGVEVQRGGLQEITALAILSFNMRKTNYIALPGNVPEDGKGADIVIRYKDEEDNLSLKHVQIKSTPHPTYREQYADDIELLDASDLGNIWSRRDTTSDEPFIFSYDSTRALWRHVMQSHTVDDRQALKDAKHLKEVLCQPKIAKLDALGQAKLDK